MKESHQSIFPLLLFVLTAFVSVNLYAVGVGNQSENVFRFQQKLAKKGNAYAQYKLATMYETGSGVEADVVQAKQWYQQASAKGVKAASDRNTFLTIKEQGFNKAEHQGWLEGIEDDAKARKVEAMHLLGQLYHKGIGVEKNLDKSLALLTYVSSSGSGNVDDEIASIHDEIEANNIAAQTKESPKKRSIKKQSVVSEKHAVNPASKTVAKKATTAKTPSIKVAKKKPNTVKKAQLQKQGKTPVKAKAEIEHAKNQAMLEKKRRYEQVMAKIKLEQQLINEQQAQVTGGNLAAVDDEF